MNLQQENEALKEACTKALESAKRNRLNLKEVLKENEQLRYKIAALQEQIQVLQNANDNLQNACSQSGSDNFDAWDFIRDNEMARNIKEINRKL